jgi:hypothetical protein
MSLKTPAIGFVSTNVTSGNTARVYVNGLIKNTSWSFTARDKIYLSNSTEGGITNALPTSTGMLIQVIGIAINSNTILFNPSLTIIEL